MHRSLIWLGLLFAAAASAQPAPDALRDQLCERALRVGGALEEYLEGVGLDDPAAVARVQALFERLAEAHSELPESYVKLAVLMAAEGGEVSPEAAEATLAILAGCVPEPEPTAAPPESPPAPPAIGDPRQKLLEGVALADRGAAAEAEAVFRSLIATYPQLPEPYVNLAALLAAKGDENGAGAVAESALLAHPVCRAAFELEMLRDLGDHSRSLLAGLRRQEHAHRVVGPDWIPFPGSHLEEMREIAGVVKAWLAAWTARRADEYLGFYAQDFRPAAGDARSWRAERRRRLAETGPEKLEISDLDIDVSSPVTGTASFHLVSRYGGAGVAVAVEKILELEKADGA